VTDITLNNGVTKLAASIYGSTDAEPLLFLHGISHSRDTWDEIAHRLMRRCQVWTLDFRGHGHSDRASNYDLAGYVSDAETALAAIGRPAIVVGHSLGACVAGLIAQGGPANVRGVFLEDPPWFLGDPDEWGRSAFPHFFSILAARQASWQRESAPLGTYLDFLSNAPSPMGGVASNHVGPRHLLSHASALQRQDNLCWASADGGVGSRILADIPTDRDLNRPSFIIQADPNCGAALLDGHEERLRKANPQAEIVRYDGSGHSPHRALAFEERFVRDLEGFLAKVGMA
jgi:pimeloyl-ACP methyl ester carboxylesterase